ncbi:5'-3' exonuclease H3TH domain-containing protein [Psychromonas sp. SP041]|uniref:5'-3' exonuclease n=1 Tax=Psychromonas sp. SP041 TaxID=1365007 RepID=UPI0010C7810C|nr:5'-3' exonuclease H3TH domain-containing protein [Psychromonas sp. SP041]
MPKKAIVFDLNNLLYRKFYTSIPRYNNDGLRNDVTLTIYSEMAALKNKIGQEDEIIIVSDHNGPTFRHHLVDSYKSDKKGMPEELKCQEDSLIELLLTSGFKLISKPGYEADDAIGMVCNHFINHGFSNIEIHSNDKDLLQLINDNVSVFNPSSRKLFRRAEVIQKYGIPPEMIPDMLAIAGDSADSIKGLEGVGEKTACNWINEFGNAKSVFSNKENAKGRGSKSLRESDLNIDLNLKLSTIVSDPSLLSSSEVQMLLNWEASPNASNVLKQIKVGSSLSHPSIIGAPEENNITTAPSQMSFF